MRSIASSFLLWTLTVEIAVAQQQEAVNRRCAPTDYYYQLLQTESTANEWTREDLEDLLRTTHLQITPFFGSQAGQGDVLEALIKMDGSARSIELFYSNLSVPQYPLDRSGWVAEHVCPILMSTVVQDDFDAAFSDLHNIRPVHPQLHESARGTQYFGVCPTCIELLHEGSETCICGDFFQPPEEVRGVVARSLLYMQLRYPDLLLSNCHLEQLLAWHMEFPPTDEEQERNGIICSQWQGNRNPYVDFPEIAFSIRARETSCDITAGHGDMHGGNDHGYGNEDLLGEALPIDEFEESDAGYVEGGGVLEFDMEDDDQGYGSRGESPTGGGGSIWDNIFAVGEVLENEVDHCASLLPGDINFYVMQAGPSRMGFMPLIDLPKGLTLFMSDTLSSFASTSIVRLANDIPETPLLRITLEKDLQEGTPFGYGRNLQLGYDWEVVTEPVVVRGKAIGGDELFLFCYDKHDRLRLLSALTTNGSFRDAETTGADFSLDNTGFGIVVLSEPMDYYVYNGPPYATRDSYQRAMMSPYNWLGFDLTSPPPDASFGGGGGSRTPLSSTGGGSGVEVEPTGNADSGSTKLRASNSGELIRPKRPILALQTFLLLSLGIIVI